MIILIKSGSSSVVIILSQGGKILSSSVVKILSQGGKILSQGGKILSSSVMKILSQGGKILSQGGKIISSSVMKILSQGGTEGADTDAEIERIKSEIELEQKNKQTLGEDKNKDSEKYKNYDKNVSKVKLNSKIKTNNH